MPFAPKHTRLPSAVLNDLLKSVGPYYLALYVNNKDSSCSLPPTVSPSSSSSSSSSSLSEFSFSARAVNIKNDS